MNGRALLGILLVLLLVVGMIGGAAYFVKARAPSGAGDKGASSAPTASTPTAAPASTSVASETQQRLDALSKQMVADLQAESRLNLNMLGQLRGYQQLLAQIETYAQDVEKQIKVIEEIGKAEFQEDVKLQASLFAGKKATLVAKHLEEFRASRVGAILAKMKEKEASAVLDIWAQQEDPKVSAFYRETMAAYLNNKRRDMNPELFETSSGS